MVNRERYEDFGGNRSGFTPSNGKNYMYVLNILFFRFIITFNLKALNKNKNISTRIKYKIVLEGISWFQNLNIII